MSDMVGLAHALVISVSGTTGLPVGRIYCPFAWRGTMAYPEIVARIILAPLLMFVIFNVVALAGLSVDYLWRRWRLIAVAARGKPARRRRVPAPPPKTDG